MYCYIILFYFVLHTILLLLLLTTTLLLLHCSILGVVKTVLLLLLRCYTSCILEACLFFLYRANSTGSHWKTSYSRVFKSRPGRRSTWKKERYAQRSMEVEFQEKTAQIPHLIFRVWWHVYCSVWSYSWKTIQ